MLVRGLAALVGIAGCNWAFGLEPGVYQPPPDADRPDADPRADLDRDGIKDIDDPCIAPEVDGLLDTDQDMVINASDACPFDKDARSDVDGDGIGDACDPFGVAGDRLRCLMVFSDADMNVLMWKLRDATAQWFMYEPRVLFGYRGSVTAEWPLEGNAPSTTFDIYGRITFSSNMPGRLDVLPRAGATPQPTDAGCSLISGGTWTLSTLPGLMTPQVVMTQTTASHFRLRVTVQPMQTGPNIRCTLRWPTGSITTFASTTVWPTGYLAFSTANTSVGIFGIAVYERDDAPAP